MTMGLDMMAVLIKTRQFDTRIGLTGFNGPTDRIDRIEEILGIGVSTLWRKMNTRPLKSDS